MATNSTRGDSVPLYRAVMDGLKKRIDSGAFNFDKPFCTENSVMEQFKVSRITARRAMAELEAQGILLRRRGAGSFINRECYAAQRMRSEEEAGRTFTFVFPFTTAHTGIMDLLSGADEVCKENGYRINVVLSGHDESTEADTLTRLLDTNAAGVALWPRTSRIHQLLLSRFLFSGHPAVIMDIPGGCPYIPSVTSDNYEGGRLLAGHLLSLGHRRIAFIGGTQPDDRASVSERLAGMLTKFAEAGIPLDTDLIHCTLRPELLAAPLSEPESLRNLLLRLTKQGVTAILAENDEMGYAILLSCRELGIAVPTRLSVCGFDNSDFSTMLVGSSPSLRLTTVAQDRWTMGQTAARLLIENRSVPPHLCTPVRVPVKLIVGNTTAQVWDGGE